MNDTVELDGILKHGYGIIPKYLMELDLDTILDNYFKENEVYNYVIKDKKNKIKEKTTIKSGIGRGKYMKLVLSYLLSFCGFEKQTENGTKKMKEECYPFVNTIAEKLQLTRSLVVEALNDLEALEMIRKEKKYPENSLKKGNKYIIQIFSNSFFSKFEGLRGRLPRSTGQTPEVYGADSVLSNNNSINNNIHNKYISPENNSGDNTSNKNKFPVNLTKINKRILILTKKAFSAVGFTNVLPGDDAEFCSTKTYEAIQTFFYNLHECKIKSGYAWDEKWIKDCHIDFRSLREKAVGTNGSSRLSWEEIEKLLEKATKNYKLMLTEGYWPEDKKRLTLNFKNFLYNFVSKNSWFLCCLFNEPRQLQEVVAENLIKDLPEDVQALIKDFGEGEKAESWPRFAYYSKIRDLYLWYKKRLFQFRKYHDLRGLGGGGFWPKLGSFSGLIDIIYQYMCSWRDDWTVNHFGLNCKTWNLFLKWVLKEFGFDLGIDDDELEKAEKEYDLRYPKWANLGKPKKKVVQN
jgi:hypothetical protein